MEFLKDEYKNEGLAKIVEAIVAELGVFEERRRGSAFKAILFTLASVYQEDRPTLYKQFGVSQTKQTRPTGPSGGARITRYKDQKPKRRISSSGCDGCPDPPGVASGQAEAKNTLKKKADRIPAPDPSEVFTSKDDVLSRFEGNVIAMRAFCQDKGINVSKSITRAETIARKIFEFYENK